MADHKVGKLFVELDLDPSRYLKANQQIYKSATQTSLDIEKNFRNLGIKSDSTFNLMRAGAQNSFNQIVNSTKASANDRVRAEEAMAAKFKSIHEQQFGHQTTLIESMKKNWMAASAVAISAYYAASKFYDLAERGAKVTAVEESFTAMSKNFGVAGDALIKKMEEVTKNTIDNSDLMAKAVRLISEGFSEKQIVGISEAARVSARLTGKTISEAYDSISESILNLRERGLKTAGIIVDMDKAERQYAATLGVTKEQLSDYGRRMAWAAAIMEKTKEDAAKLGESLAKLNDFEQFQKRTAVWKEFGDQLGKIASFFVRLATAIVSVNLAWNKFITQKWESEIKKAGSTLESWGIISPSPSKYLTSERMTGGEPERPKGPSQIKVADKLPGGEKAKAIQYTSSQIFGSMQEEGRWLSWWQGINKEIDHTPDLVEAVTAEIAQMTRENEELGKIALKTNQAMIDAWGVPSAAEILTEIDKVIEAEQRLGEAAINRMELQESTWEMHKKKLKEESAWIGDIGASLSNAWSSNLVNIVRGTESMSEKVKSLFQSIGDVFLSVVTKMIANWVLFGNTTGKEKSGGGYGGLLGSIAGAISGIGGGLTAATAGSMTSTTIGTTSTFPKGSFQHGTDYVPETGLALLHKGEAVIPAEKNISAKKGGEKGLFDQLLKGSMSLPSYQHGTDYVPQTGPAFLHAGEMVIPESKSKGGKGDTYLTIIEATDVESFAKRYGPVIEGIYHKGKRYNKVLLR